MSRLRVLAKTVIGTMIEWTHPSLARAVDSGAPVGAAFRKRNLIIHARRERARRRGDPEAVKAAQAGYWKGETADLFYDRYTARFRDWFLGPHQVIVDRLVDLDREMAFANLVEIGCGDGRVLAHCAERLPGLERATGLDINPTIIARNRETYAGNPKLHFVDTEAGAWLSRNCPDGTVLMTYGGVMEYFTEADLSAMLTRIARLKRGAVAFVEPLAPGHDLSTRKDSFIFGGENSFSHNYPHLIRQAGLLPVFEQEMELGLVRWMLILARTAIPEE